ncbi:MAG: hypothetical protein IJE97_12735 [Thermoguttaceae bacterium]|nr:hypothetical protein [Thermoguttaceae bacterium]
MEKIETVTWGDGRRAMIIDGTVYWPKNFENFSRSVVNWGASKIYWRKRFTQENVFGSWNDGVWFRCETGEVVFGDQARQAFWSDVYDETRKSATTHTAKIGEKTTRRVRFASNANDPLRRGFSWSGYWAWRESRRRSSLEEGDWFLGNMSEWNIDDADIEGQLAVRLAEAAAFCEGFGVDGSKRTAPTQKLGKELVRFYKTIERVAETQRRTNGKAALDDAPPIRVFCRYRRNLRSSSRLRKPRLEFICDPALLRVDYAKHCAEYEARYKRWKLWEEYAELEWSRRNGERRTETGLRAWNDVDEARWREIGVVKRCERPKPLEETLGFYVHKSDLRLYGAYSDNDNDEVAYLGYLNELIGWAKTGGEEARRRWRFGAFATRWPNRVASLIDCRIERYRAVYEAAKELYVLILTTSPREMKNVEIYVSRDGFRLATEKTDDSFVRVGTLFEFYDTADNYYWGNKLSTESKFAAGLEARHWVAEILCRWLQRETRKSGKS